MYVCSRDLPFIIWTNAGESVLLCNLILRARLCLYGIYPSNNA